MAVSPPKAPPRATTVVSARPAPKPRPDPLPDGLAATRARVRRRGWLAGLLGPVRAVLAVVTSLLMWALLGWWAGRRVSQQVVGGWREWAVEFGWVALCLWAGVLTGVGVLLHLAS